MAKLMRSERRFGIMCERIRTVFLLRYPVLKPSCMKGKRWSGVLNEISWAYIHLYGHVWEVWAQDEYG